MSRLRPSHNADPDPYDDGPLPDLTSGLMWLATAANGVVVQALPGTEHEHTAVVTVLIVFAVAWGAICLVLGVRRWTMSIQLRALVTATMMPIVAVALWATGGASSYLAPALLFTALFISWFFPPRLAWPLTLVFLLAYVSPLAFDSEAIEVGFPARAFGFAVAVVGSVLAMQFLKRRLVRAEALQRSFAELDPLTAVSNRRGFDRALARAEQREQQYALILFDMDDFKAINDTHGHPVGDEVLRAVADAARTAVRQGDCLARIGGDEFALVAPGAGRGGALRLVHDLRRAIEVAPLPAEVGDVGVTFAWAVGPDEDVVAHADRMLLARKGACRPPARNQRGSGGASPRLVSDEEAAVALELDAVDDEGPTAAQVADHVPVDR